MNTIVPMLALALSLAAGCSDDDDTMQGTSPITGADAATPAHDAALDCQPGYVERCTQMVGDKPIKRCSCVEDR